MTKVFERELWVDYEYTPKDKMPELPSDVRGSYEKVMHALIGDCVYWGTTEFGFSKKVRITVEVLEENE